MNKAVEKYIKKKNGRISVIVIRMEPIGDTILTTPIYEIIKRHYPESKISVVILEQFACLLKNNPYIDEIYSFKKKDMFKYLLKKIIFKKFDFSIDFVNNPRTSWITLFIWAKFRIGKYKLRNWFYNRKLTIDPCIYTVHHSIGMLEPIGITDMKFRFFYRPDDESFDFIKKYFTENRIKKPIGMFISSHYPVQNWGADNYIKLADKIISKYKIDVLLIPGIEDRINIGNFKSRIKSRKIHIASETTIDQLGALIGSCQCFIGNDGGPKHMSVAQNIPTFTILGGIVADVWNPPDVDRFPYIKAELDCVPCSRRYCETLDCFKLLDVDTVFEKVSVFIRKYY